MTDSAQTAHEQICRKLYDLYADYVLKNPFYTLEMPIRVELFDIYVAKMVEVIQG